MNNSFTAIAIGSLITTLLTTNPTEAKPIPLTQLFPALVGIELNSTQQVNLARLSEKTLPQIKKILTPAQVQQFDSTLKQGKSVRSAIFALDLSMLQQFKLTGKLQSMQSNLTSILTPEQQQQVAKNAKSLRQISK